MKALLHRQCNQLAFACTMALLLAVAACSTLGLPSAKNFGERIAVEIATVTEVRNGAGTLLAAKKITADDAQNVQDQADTARKGLEVARSMRASNPAAAQTKLDATILVLQGLKSYLATRNSP